MNLQDSMLFISLISQKHDKMFDVSAMQMNLLPKTTMHEKIVRSSIDCTEIFLLMWMDSDKFITNIPPLSRNMFPVWPSGIKTHRQKLSPLGQICKTSKLLTSLFVRNRTESVLSQFCMWSWHLLINQVTLKRVSNN